jgi:hypothetical protein
MIKNAHTYSTSFFVGRPVGGEGDVLVQDKSWGVNAHMRIEGWRD